MNQNSDQEDKKNKIEKRIAISALYQEWILKGLARERRKGESTKTNQTEKNPPSQKHIQNHEEYHHLLKKIFHPSVRSSIIEESSKNLHEYIKSIKKLEEKEEKRPSGKHPFVTISRQAGTGGHLLAHAILMEMEQNKEHPLFQGWQVLDQEICQSVMNDPSLKVSMENLVAEKFDPEFEDYLKQIFAGTSPQISIYHKISQIIRTFSLIGKTIIVGRAGSLLTRDLPGGVHVRMVASHKTKIHQIMYQLNISEKEAEKIIDEKEASRVRLVKTCFNEDIDNPLLYDAVWNTDSVPIPMVAKMIVEMIKEKSHHLHK